MIRATSLRINTKWTTCLFLTSLLIEFLLVVVSSYVVKNWYTFIYPCAHTHLRSGVYREIYQDFFGICVIRFQFDIPLNWLSAILRLDSMHRLIQCFHCFDMLSVKLSVINFVIRDVISPLIDRIRTQWTMVIAAEGRTLFLTWSIAFTCVLSHWSSYVLSKSRFCVCL